MKISLNYLKKYIDFELPAIDLLLERIGSQLGAIDEGVVDLWEIYNQVIVVKIVDCKPIEGSDHLNLCFIDDNKKFHDDSVRGPDGLIQVVCGAPNVAKEQLVAWLPPKSVIPSTFAKEKLTLESKELQGNISHGMIASAKELAIDDDHNGILLIDKEANPGDSFAKLYELDDYIIDIENKMFTHRPDCFGLLGIARELSGILNKPFKSPDWYLNQPNIEPAKEDLAIKVENEIPSLVPRFSAISLDNLRVIHSPILVRSYLSRMGIRPVNSIVDATNLCMLETGQPLHAYDYSKLKELSAGNEVSISVWNPKSNEKVDLINEKTVIPRSEAIVIACNQPVGLGGIMGAANSAISEGTKSIVLEAANFDMYSIRRSAMELGIFSDAVTRFTKGQSPLQTTRVLTRAIELIKQLCGDSVAIASELVDDNHLPEATTKRDSLHPPIKVRTDYINQRLGTDLSSEDMAGLLNNVECKTETSTEEITLSLPFWRTDIEIREDVIEEVGRLYGFDKIKLTEMTRNIKPAPINKSLDTKIRLRHALASAGANEVLNYSFVSKKLMENCHQDIAKAYELANSLSPEVQYYRLSLIPSLLSKVNSNIRAGFTSFSLFEIGTYHLIEEEFPNEHNSLALVFASNKESKEPSYYQARAYLDFLAKKLGLKKLKYLLLADAMADLPAHLIEVSKPFEPNRSAVIQDSEGQLQGIVGEFKPGSINSLKLPISCAGLEVNSTLFESNSSSSSYHKLSKFPLIKQDMTLKLPRDHSYQELELAIEHQLNHHLKDEGFFEIELLSVFQPPDEQDFTNYAFRISIADYNKTLKDDEVNQMLDILATEIGQKLSATRI